LTPAQPVQHYYFFRRSHQPRLGVGSSNTYLFDDDPGIMSEIETSSTRFRKTNSSTRDRPPPAASSGAATRAPRTSPSSRSSSSAGGSGGYGGHMSNSMHDDDSGIMSEAETSSTTRGKRSSSGHGHGGRNNSIPSMGYGKQPQRSVQFRYPVAQFQVVFPV
jgi:hypothetical protein